MAFVNVSLALNNTSGVKKTIQKQVVKNYYTPIIRQTAIHLKQDKKIPQLITKYLFLQPILRAVMGAFPGNESKDLEAIFGLTDEAKTSFISGLVAYLHSVIHITTKTTENNAQLSVGFLTSREQQELINSNFEWGEYISNPSGELIPFFQWLMLMESDPIFDYMITFSLTEIGKKTSRSGRALMVSADNPIFDEFDDDDVALENLFWQLDLSSFKQENFVVALFKNENFQNRVFKIIDTTFNHNWDTMVPAITSKRNR